MGFLYLSRELCKRRVRWLLSFFLCNWLNPLSIVLPLKATMIKETNCEILEKFLRRKDIWSSPLYWLSHFCHSSCRTWCSGRSANVLSEQVIVQGLPISWLLNKWQHRTPLGFGTVLISACLCAIVLNLKKGTWRLRSYIFIFIFTAYPNIEKANVQTPASCFFATVGKSNR